MSAEQRSGSADEAVLATFFPGDSAFRAVTEPRTLPESWRADQFDTADRRATKHVGYAVLMLRGRLNGELGNRHVIRVLYVTGDLSATTYRDYECVNDEGYRPPTDRWRCTLARLLDEQYEVGSAGGREEVSEQ
jgi:hypothetical protein